MLIKVSPLTYRILLTDLHYEMVDDVAHIDTTTSSPIEIDMAARIPERPSINMSKLTYEVDISYRGVHHQMGHYLHMMHADRMYKFIEAYAISKNRKKGSIRAAIRLFVNIYGIEEDHWNFDTIDRMWRKRLKVFISKKRFTLNATDTKKNGAKELHEMVRRPLVEVKELLSERIAEHIDEIYDAQHRPNYKLIRHIERAILYESGYNVQTIAELYNVDKSNISRSLRKVS